MPTVTSKTGVRQSHVPTRLDLVPKESLFLLGECLAFGADKYGADNWKTAASNADHRENVRDNINHAIAHLYNQLAGDTTEPHLVNALARINFAIWHAVRCGDQAEKYEHPEAAALERTTVGQAEPPGAFFRDLY